MTFLGITLRGVKALRIRHPGSRPLRLLTVIEKSKLMVKTRFQTVLGVFLCRFDMVQCFSVKLIYLICT